MTYLCLELAGSFGANWHNSLYFLFCLKSGLLQAHKKDTIYCSYVFTENDQKHFKIQMVQVPGDIFISASSIPQPSKIRLAKEGSLVSVRLSCTAVISLTQVTEAQHIDCLIVQSAGI